MDEWFVPAKQEMAAFFDMMQTTFGENFYSEFSMDKAYWTSTFHISTSIPSIIHSSAAWAAIPFQKMIFDSEVKNDNSVRLSTTF